MDIEKSFRPVTKLDKAQLNSIKMVEDGYCNLAHGVNNLVDSREKSLALTYLQLSKMFATECIAKNYGG